MDTETDPGFDTPSLLIVIATIVTVIILLITGYHI